MISYIDLKTHIEEGENNFKEFKPNYTNHKESIKKTIVAYANDISFIGGGYIYIGVDDNSNIIGFLEDYDFVQKDITDFCRQCANPQILIEVKLLEHNIHKLLEIKVVRSINRPHRFKGICYIRLASTTRKASLDEETFIKQNTYTQSFDEQPLAKTTVNDIDWSKFNKFISQTKAAIYDDVTKDDVSIATNLDYVIDMNGVIIPKIGTILLFGMNPQKLFNYVKIQILRFKGLDITSQIITRKVFDGDLIQQMNETRQYLENIINTGIIIDQISSKRYDYFEYPFIVIREALANAIMHRDYSIDGREIDIRIFDDRIEFESPGTLGGGLSISDLGTGKRFIRNSLIASVMNELKYAERAGTGIARIKKSMLDNGSPEPEFFIDNNTFKVIIPSHPYYSSRRMMEEGIQEKIQANYEKASELFKKALDVNPNNYFALTNWAELELQVGNRESARTFYQKAIKVDEKNPTAWLGLAFLEEKHGSLSTARDTYKNAVKKVDNVSLIYRSWAILEWYEHKYHEAEDLFDKALIASPNDFMTLYKHGQMSIGSPIDQKKRKGEALLKKALALTNDDYQKADIYFLLARAMSTLRYSFDEVEEYYTRSLGLNPNRGVVHYNYGQFLKKNGKIADSDKHLNLSRRLNYYPKKKFKKY